MCKFYEHLNNLLKENFADVDGNILRNSVVEKALQCDKQLLKILLDDEKTREVFFEDIGGVKVFDKIKFSWVINNREFLPDSYTGFKNKIGLTDYNDRFNHSTWLTFIQTRREYPRFYKRRDESPLAFVLNRH